MAFTHIKLFGERNTNTNYLKKLIRVNFRVKLLTGKSPRPVVNVQKLLDGEETLRDWYFSHTSRRNLGWKHQLVDVNRLLQSKMVANHRVAFLCIVKNPYAWLLSMHRRPYHQVHETPLNFDQFIRNPWQIVAREHCPTQIENPMQLWNRKNNAYIEVRDSLNGNIVCSEELLANTEEVINKIGAKFSLRRRADTFVDYNKSTKDRSKDKAYYVDYYGNERWKKNLTKDQVHFINQHLDPDLVNELGYAMI